MDVETEKEMLQRFALYVFRREAVEIREDLYESLVEMSLYLANKPLNRRTIKNEIMNQLALDLSEFIVNSAIDSLVNKGYIKQHDEQFYLTYSRRKVINKTIKERRRSLLEIEDKFVSEYRAKVRASTSEEDRIALGYLYKFLSRLFSSEGKLLLGIMRGTREGIEFVKEYDPPGKVLRDLIMELKDAEIKEAVRDSIISIFRKDETTQLLNVVARNFLYFQLLNLDPECRLFEKEAFSKKVLLLDTNFVMKLLFISEPGHQAAVRCARLSRELGVQLRFTKRTKQEFLDQLLESNKRFKKLRVTKIDTLSSLSDGVIASYALEKQKKPILKWKDFFYKYRTFQTILNMWGITEFEEALPPLKVYENGSKDPVTGYVLACWHDLTGRIKSETIAEHDTYHLLLIRKLRAAKPSDILGPRFWFLTFDSSLLCVDKAVNEVIGSKYDLPSSIELWAWIELIAPYLAPKVSSELGVQGFSNLMKTQLSLLPARIDVKKLIAVQTPEVNFDLFSCEQTKAILSDRFVQQHWRKMVWARQTGSPAAKKHQKQLQERAVDVAKTILMKRTKAEVITRYISAAMSILLFILMCYCALLEKYTGAVILGFFAFGLIAIAVGYSTIEINLRKLRARLQSE